MIFHLLENWPVESTGAFDRRPASDMEAARAAGLRGRLVSLGDDLFAIVREHIESQSNDQERQVR